jgi:glycosyltransferase involved in cell wall biosynthesis
LKWPRITVVTPSFNHGRFIERTIRSVVDQQYPNLDYIVMDGGSTDDTVEILHRYEDQLTHWESKPDGGQTDALIKGFALSTGEIQCWLCSDDLLEPGTLTEVARFFEENPAADVVYGDSYWIDDEDRPLRPKKEHGFNRFVWLYHYNFVPQPSTFWRRHLYERIGGLDRTYDLAMDADLWIRFAAETKVHHVRRPWSRMRQYAGQKNQRLREVSDREDRAIRSRYVGSVPTWEFRARHAAARALRVALKASHGSYW